MAGADAAGQGRVGQPGPSAAGQAQEARRKRQDARGKTQDQRPAMPPPASSAIFC